jgi:hypothetical protein
MLPDDPGEPLTMPASTRMWPAMELAMRHGVFLIVQGKPCTTQCNAATQQRSNAATQQRSNATRDEHCAAAHDYPTLKDHHA